MSKEQALKYSGLALQSTSSPVNVPSVTKTSSTMTKRPSSQIDASNTVDSSAVAAAVAAASSLQILGSSTSALFTV